MYGFQKECGFPLSLMRKSIMLAALSPIRIPRMISGYFARAFPTVLLWTFLTLIVIDWGTDMITSPSCKEQRKESEEEAGEEADEEAVI